MYAVTSLPLVNLTLAILRRAEFGFFGVLVETFVQTPRFWGQEIATVSFFKEFMLCCKAGDLDL
jgi:hypothetical protein